MEQVKRKRLEAAGWKVGSTSDFLELTPEEAEIVEMRVSLARTLKEERSRVRLSQGALAARIGSSQSRVAKMESGDSSVSLDLLIKALLATGASRKKVAKAIGS